MEANSSHEASGNRNRHNEMEDSTTPRSSTGESSIDDDATLPERFNLGDEN